MALYFINSLGNTCEKISRLNTSFEFKQLLFVNRMEQNENNYSRELRIYQQFRTHIHVCRQSMKHGRDLLN